PPLKPRRVSPAAAYLPRRRPEESRGLAEVKALRRYRLGRREDYVQYKALARAVRALARRLRDLGPASAAFRARCAAALLEKLYGLGLVSCRRSLAVCENLSAAAFCRRRLPCLLVKLRMAQNLRHAVTFVEQGHVRVGPEVVTDPALLVPRAVEDFVTWVDASHRSGGPPPSTQSESAPKGLCPPAGEDAIRV
uniref:IMP U3 small nucleolar ribonucleoprotein 3 n=1 Tax=Aquila chrysaetos chrysaetos TaxID=223781 RepID=A0A663EJD3_AQUCH